MSEFRFKFESVLKHRQAEEQQCQRELAQQLQARMQFQQQLGQMQQQIRDSKHQMSQSLVGKVDLDQLSAFARYSGQTTSRAQHLVRQLGRVEQQVQTSRAKLLEATKARKALELLRDRHEQAWRAEQARKERLELDELATQRYLREQQALSSGGER